MPTGVALTAIHVGFNAATITRFDVRHAFAHFDDLNAEFMPRNPREIKKRKFSKIATDVGTTHAHAVCAHQSFSGSRFAGSGNVD
jgi:hypothetical protein